MAHDGFSITRGAHAVGVPARPSAAAATDFTTVLFTGLSASVFLVLLGCVVVAAILFGQGV